MYVIIRCPLFRGSLTEQFHCNVKRKLQVEEILKIVPDVNTCNRLPELPPILFCGISRSMISGGLWILGMKKKNERSGPFLLAPDRPAHCQWVRSYLPRVLAPDILEIVHEHELQALHFILLAFLKALWVHQTQPRTVQPLSRPLYGTWNTCLGTLRGTPSNTWLSPNYWRTTVQLLQYKYFIFYLSFDNCIIYSV